MEIRRLTGPLPPASPRVTGRLVSPFGTRQAVWAVPEETPLAILLNGTAFAVMMATPADLEDFALGFALTEGIVESLDQVESLRIAEAADGFVLNLLVPPDRVEAVEERRRSLAGRAGCGLCGAQTIAAALPKPRRVSGLPPTPHALFAAYRAFPAAQPMRASNHSTHAAAYCTADGSVALVREDIGRHNALDKLAGALARAGRDASGGFVLLSSRISVEMVQKAAAIRAPFLAAVSAPSALALRVAAEAGMGLAGRAGDAMMIFDAARIRESAA
ncbi:MAG TPA: formate dehydrogenase accessory sulfurtransferase FdhD [Paracoccaceae bacterium]|nr:formate dehydrogenase accessory sulfurtransferase FdhD [Paracoccaceae bacterium]